MDTGGANMEEMSRQVFSSFLVNNTVEHNAEIIGACIAQLMPVETVALAFIEQKLSTFTAETGFWSRPENSREGQAWLSFLREQYSDIIKIAGSLRLVPQACLHSLNGISPEDNILLFVIRYTSNVSVILLVSRTKAPWQDSEQKKLSALYGIIESLFAERVLLKKEQFVNMSFNTILNQMQAHIYISDVNTYKILFMNDSMKKDYGLENPEGKTCWQVLQHGMKDNCPFCPVERLIKNRQTIPIIQWEEANTATGRIFHNFDSLINWIDGSLVHLQQSIDITDLKSANTDELTQILTRRPGKNALSASLDKAEKENRILTVCLYDINLLKQVNDRYGHAQGDNLITSIVTTVKKYLKEGEYEFRLSGDEFVVVFGERQEDVQKRMEAILNDLKNAPMTYEMSFCYGLVEILPGQAATVEEILLLADERMYIQKRRFHILENDRRLAKAESAAADSSYFAYDSEFLYDALVESTDSYLFVCNMKTGVFRYPRAMVEEFGLPGEVIENAAAVWGSKVHEDDRTAFLESNQEIADGRADSHCVEYRAKNRRGEWIKVRCRGRLERDEAGTPVLFAGFITNLGVAK